MAKQRGLVTLADAGRWFLAFPLAAGLSLIVHFLGRHRRAALGHTGCNGGCADNVWRVRRCAAKEKKMREAEGGNRSQQRKVNCTFVTVNMDGVMGVVQGWWNSKQVADHNEYRTQGHQGNFEPGTRDRAVSIVTASVYDELRAILPGAKIAFGDLGENFLVEGPSHDGLDLVVGTRLRIGANVELELTEANKPCFRLKYLRWGSIAEKKFGEQWWKNTDLPLAGKQCTGGRGWLAKVIVEGDVFPGDAVNVVVGFAPKL